MGLAKFFRPRPAVGPEARAALDSGVPRVLNVGGSNKQVPIPHCYLEWDHVLLDIDPRGNPDIVCDAREMHSLPSEQFDAVYCSHNLEHFYKHDCDRVLTGFRHVLKPEGFVDVSVPDLMAVMRHVVKTGMDIEDVLFRLHVGMITVRDVIYGWSAEIERSGVDYFAHKTGFSERSLLAALLQAGFAEAFAFLAPEVLELRVIGFKTRATDAHWELLGLPHG